MRGVTLVEKIARRSLLQTNFMGIKLEKFRFDLPETLVDEHDYYKFIRSKTTILNHIPDHTLRTIYRHMTNEQTHWRQIPWINKEWLYEGAL